METAQIRLSTVPSLSRAYLKAAFSRKPTTPGPTPIITATLDDLRFDAQRLAIRYLSSIPRWPRPECSPSSS